jgi:glycerophosphoryl diester phosphodiesterase
MTDNTSTNPPTSDSAEHGSAAAADLWLPRRPLVVAHRANAPGVVENSLAGVRENARLGADLVELDVRRSLEGVPFVLHDWYLGRTVPGRVPIRSVPSPILRRLRLKGGTGEHVPTLDEILRFIAEHADAPGPALHIKDQGALRTALNVVNQWELAPRTWLWLHGPAAARLARNLAPESKITLVEGRERTRSDWSRHIATARSVEADAVSLPWQYLSPDVLAEAADAGLQTFSVNRDLGALVPMVEAGLTGVITDDPLATLRTLREQWHQPTP